MAKPAVCVDPDMDIRYCSRLKATCNLMRVLVGKDDRLSAPSTLVPLFWMGRLCWKQMIDLTGETRCQ
jgi:hypothetical protein